MTSFIAFAVRQLVAEAEQPGGAAGRSFFAHATRVGIDRRPIEAVLIGTEGVRCYAAIVITMSSSG